MSIDLTNCFNRLRIRLTAGVAMLLLPLTAIGQEIGEPLTGTEVLPQAIQIVQSGNAACALRDSGDVFCWERSLPLINRFESFFPDIAGFSKLNAALNNDIASITLDYIHLCGIGRVSGVACVDSDRPRIIAYTDIQRPPEPDASYLSISNLADSNAIVCGIQTDNWVVCWGSRGRLTESFFNLPPELAYLQQLDLDGFRACGIDLNNAVVCWGYPLFESNTDDYHFGDVDIATIGPAKHVSIGVGGACVIDMNDSLECFGRINSFTDLFSGQSFSSVQVHNSRVCYETTSGEKNCEALIFSDNGTSSESAISPSADVRLLSPYPGVCCLGRLS